MRYLPAAIRLAALSSLGAGLAACAAKPTVLRWASSTTSLVERVEIKSDGEARYTSTADGKQLKEERVVLSQGQLAELADMFRTKHACELAHDPSYTPAADEASVTLELSFPDQRCSVTLWDVEWKSGDARELAETLASMRQTRAPASREVESPRDAAKPRRR